MTGQQTENHIKARSQEANNSDISVKGSREKNHREKEAQMRSSRGTALFWDPKEKKKKRKQTKKRRKRSVSGGDSWEKTYAGEPQGNSLAASRKMNPGSGRKTGKRGAGGWSETQCPR